MKPTVITTKINQLKHLDRLRLVHGRLLDQQDVDAIVMAVTDDLSLDSPLNEIIMDAAGPKLEADILDHIYKPKPGDCYSFDGYDLAVGHLIVVVKPAPKTAVILEDKFLLRTYKVALAHAEKIGIKTISFPAMGSEYLKYPPDRAARLGIAALSESIYDDLEEVRVVCKDEQLYKAFFSRLRKSGWTPKVR